MSLKFRPIFGKSYQKNDKKIDPKTSIYEKIEYIRLYIYL